MQGWLFEPLVRADSSKAWYKQQPQQVLARQCFARSFPLAGRFCILGCTTQYAWTDNHNENLLKNSQANPVPELPDEWSLLDKFWKFQEPFACVRYAGKAAWRPMPVVLVRPPRWHWRHLRECRPVHVQKLRLWRDFPVKWHRRSGVLPRHRWWKSSHSDKPWNILPFVEDNAKPCWFLG